MFVFTCKIYHLSVGIRLRLLLMRTVPVAARVVSIVIIVVLTVGYTNDVYHTKRISLEGVDLLEL